jgi:putative DNA methylase
MVDDPSEHPDLFPTEQAQEKERERLFRIIEEVVKWESTTDERVLESARDAIWQSWRHTCAENVDDARAGELFQRNTLPRFHDPFAGGGALPLEAQRLGLDTSASDLNPVAVLINTAMLQIPSQFSGTPPVNPEARSARSKLSTWAGAQGIAEDVLHYGRWMKEEAQRRIGHLYPSVAVTNEIARSRADLKAYVGRELPVIAWIWARTVKSPNPAFSQVEVPLAATFMLGTKPGKEVYVEPVLEPEGYHFAVRVGKPKNPEATKSGTKLSRGANFRCVMSGTPIPSEHVYAEANAGRMGTRLMAIVAEGDRGRVYLSPTEEAEALARQAQPSWIPDVPMPENPRWFSPPLYGLKSYGDLFTPRQLVALTTFSDLVTEARERVLRDAAAASLKDPVGYANGIALFLGLLVGRVSDYCSTVCTWANNPQMEIVRGTFARQALPMTWDFAEANVFGPSTGSLEILLGWVVKAIERLPARGSATVVQRDAAAGAREKAVVVSTDPPYYDNIGYADLSDYFYVWLRRSLKHIFPDVFATVAVPKAEELIASPYRHGGKDKAEAFFLEGMSQAMRSLAAQTHPSFPVTIYYAFKQSETDSEEDGATASTGWDTFLESVIRAGFSIRGTWPVRTERGGRSVGIGTNALASSIVLVCRPRTAGAPNATRREFINALRTELPGALTHLQHGNIAPVDLAQAAIGPGMAVFTRYAKVLDADGKPVSVREALALINEILDETLAKQEGDFDADSRWALAWFEQSGFSDGEYGLAETLSKAKNTSVKGLEEAGILKSSRGRVRLLKPSEFPSDWDPATDPRLTAWEIVHHLVRALDASGELGAAALVAKLGAKAEVARELAYRLYTLCERKKRAAEALTYNALVQSWPEITRLAREGGKARPATQGGLFDQDEE